MLTFGSLNYILLLNESDFQKFFSIVPKSVQLQFQYFYLGIEKIKLYMYMFKSLLSCFAAGTAQNPKKEAGSLNDTVIRCGACLHLFNISLSVLAIV